MARVKTFTDGGDLFVGDLNSIEDDYELAFSRWRTVASRSGWLDVSSAGGYIGDCSSPIMLLPGLGAADLAPGVVYLDPAEFTAGTRVAKLRWRILTVVGGTAVGHDIGVNLFPVATWTNQASTGVGSPANQPTPATLGAAVTGASLTVTSPGANTRTVSPGSAFTCPAAGFYVIQLLMGGSASSIVHFTAALQGSAV